MGGHGFIHGHDKHLVVREQALVHGLTEAEAVELWAVDGFIIHGGQFRGVFFGFTFDGFVVEARGGRHVKALGSLDVVGIVDADKVAGVLTGQGDAGGAVGFIANDEIEIVEAYLLGVMHRLDGLVGGEDDVKALGTLAGFKACGDVLALGRNGNLKVIDSDVLGLLGDLAIGAHREGTHVEAALGGPFLQGLGEQGNRRHEEEDAGLAAVVLSDAFRKAQGGKGFAGTARHDELAAVMGCKPFDGFVDRRLLVRAGLKSFTLGKIDLDGLIADFRAGKGHVPVDG